MSKTVFFLLCCLLIAGCTTKNTVLILNPTNLSNITPVQYNDFAVSSTGLASGAFAPTLTVYNNTALYCYAGTVRNEYSYASTELFHDWKEGTVLYPHIHTFTGVNTQSNYTFKLDYTLYDSNHSVNGVTFVNISNNGNMLLSNFVNNINASSFKIGSVLGFTITRLQDNAYDTYTGCVGVSQVSVHYEIDSLGSSSLFTK